MSAPAAADVFSDHAPRYTESRRRLVPDFDAFYGAAVDAVALVRGPGEAVRVLDLGAGTGLLSAHLRGRFPSAQIELLDASAAMLAEAEATLGSAVSAVHVADMATAALPAGPFDAVVSALAVHHLEDSDKRALFGRVRRVLAPDGVFVNAEQLSAPSAELDAAYGERWVADCRALGATSAEIEAARVRMSVDRCSDLETQLGWLREAGFAVTDCLYKSWRLGVYVGFPMAPLR